MGVVMEQELKKVMASFVKYPPREVQSYGYTGPITLSQYQRLESVRETLAIEGFSLPSFSGN
jgi:hypothetical protein